jgi:hypothetical protein
MFPSIVHGYVTDKLTGGPVMVFHIWTSMNTYYDSTGSSNYFFFPHPAGTIEIFCSSPGYRDWVRCFAKNNPITLYEGRTKLLCIKMTPLPKIIRS